MAGFGPLLVSREMCSTASAWSKQRKCCCLASHTTHTTTHTDTHTHILLLLTHTHIYTYTHTTHTYTHTTTHTDTGRPMYQQPLRCLSPVPVLIQTQNIILDSSRAYLGYRTSHTVFVPIERIPLREEKKKKQLLNFDNTSKSKAKSDY